MLKNPAEPVTQPTRDPRESAQNSVRTDRQSYEPLTPPSAQSGPFGCSRGHPDFQFFEERLLRKLQELDAAAVGGASTADAEGR